MFLVLVPVSHSRAVLHWDFSLGNSLRYDNYVRLQQFVRRTTYVPFRRFLGDTRREFMQHMCAALHGTLGSYLGDALQEGNVDVVACLLVLRAEVFPLISSFYLVVSAVFSCKNWNSVEGEGGEVGLRGHDT
jgi:hypothetical protein